MGSSRSYAFFSVSANGVLTHGSGGAAGNNQLVWFDRQGKFLGTVGPPGLYNDLALSPDGTRVAVNRGDAQTGNRDIWVLDVARGVPTRFTFDPADEWHPVWSPDGSQLAFTSGRDGPMAIYQKDASGAGTEKPLLRSDLGKSLYDWSPDGQFLLCGVNDPKTRWDLWVLPQGDGKPAPFLATPFNETQAQFSPGTAGAPRFIAYSLDESGQSEIYVQPFSAGAGKFQVSSSGGTARVLTRYAVAGDGKRFLVNSAGTDETASAPITVVLNWTARLK